MSNQSKPKFLPGTTYKTRGRYPRLCAVKDIYTTYNLAGEVLKFRYLATYEFMGQTIIDSDVCETTIAMGLEKAVCPKVSESVA